MEVVPGAPDPSTSGPVKSILRCCGHPSFSFKQHVRDWWRGDPSCNMLTNVARTTWLRSSMRAKWSCSPNEGCVLRTFAPLSCSTHSILKCTLVPPSTHSSPLVHARCLRWSATYGEEAGYTVHCSDHLGAASQACAVQTTVLLT